MSHDVLTSMASQALDQPVRERPGRLRRGRLLVELESSDGRRWFAKQFDDRRRYRAEVGAYVHRVPLIADRAPTMIASSDHHRAVVLSRVPGRVPSQFPPSLLHEAGRLLRLFHGEPEDDSPLDVRPALQDTVDRQVRRARRAGVTGDLDWIARHPSLSAGAPPEATVAVHGDFAPRNWLVDAAGTLRLLDFENSRRHVAGFDLARVEFRLGVRGHARFASLLDGYGRPLSASERSATTACLLSYSLGMLIWARREEKRDAADRAESMLGALHDGFLAA